MSLYSGRNKEKKKQKEPKRTDVTIETFLSWKAKNSWKLKRNEGKKNKQKLKINEKINEMGNSHSKQLTILTHPDTLFLEDVRNNMEVGDSLFQDLEEDEEDLDDIPADPDTDLTN